MTDIRPISVPASSLSALARLALACIVVYPSLLPPSRVERIKIQHRAREAQRGR